VAAFGVFGVEWDEKVGAGEYIVGAGTLALAVGTVWLARQTARQADLTKQSVEDAERPYLIAWSGPAGWMTLLPFAQSTSAPLPSRLRIAAWRRMGLRWS
jgi:hypothetical protein